MPQPTVYVDAPPAVPLPFGLMSVLQFPATTDPHMNSGVTWESQSCAEVGVTRDPCIVDEAVDDLVPVDGFCHIGTTSPFVVVALYDDSLLTAPVEELQARFDGAEQYGVEVQLAALLAAAVPAPVDASSLAGSSTEGVMAAIALVEQMLANAMPAQGVIHLDRFAATLVGSELRRDGGVLRTPLGTPVAAGGGYVDLSGAVPTEAVVYGTGPMVAYRGTVQRHRVTDQAVNTVSTLIQRPYSLGWDCAAVAASFTY